MMDELVNKIAGLGVAGLVLVGLVATSSYVEAVAITTSLALLGGPFGMIGGVVALTLIAAISSMIAKVGVETLAKAVVKKLKGSGKSEDSIIQEINNFPIITQGLRAQLREYVCQTSNHHSSQHNDTDQSTVQKQEPNLVPEPESNETGKVVVVEVVQPESPSRKDLYNIEPTKIEDAPADPEKTKKLIKSGSKFIWIGVVLVIVLQLWGNFAVNKIKNLSTGSVSRSVTVTIPKERQVQISADVAIALGNALVSARTSASRNLDQWKDETVQRVDHPFLDWYYNYFTQLGVGIHAIWINITSASDTEKAEKLIGDFQREFAKQVFQPSLMQLQMERFTREAINMYVSELNHNLSGIQSKYSVPQPTWENFLEGLGSVTYNTGTNTQDLTLASLAVGRKTYVATTAMATAIKVIGTKKAVTATVSKATSKVVTKLATKTAAKAATEGAGELTAGLLGLELLNPLAGLGILVWDIWDHYHTVKVERPIMKENLERYLNEVEASLLGDPENGVLSSINKFHDGIMETLSRSSKFSG